MIPVSLDCPFLIGPSVFSNVYLLPSLSCALLFPMLPLSLDCIFLIAPSNFSNVYLLSTVCPGMNSCAPEGYPVFAPLIVPIVLLRNCLPFASTWVYTRFLVGSLLLIFLVSCVVVFAWFVFVLCLVHPMLPVSLDCPFLIIPSVFSNVYLFCVLYTQCCQCLWIVHSWLPLRFSLTFICPVSCVPNVASVSGLSILDCPFGFL